MLNKAEINYRADKLATKKLLDAGVSLNLVTPVCGQNVRVVGRKGNKIVQVMAMIEVPMDEIENFTEPW